MAPVACVGSVRPAPATPVGATTSRFETNVRGAIVSIEASRGVSTRSAGAQAKRARTTASRESLSTPGLGERFRVEHLRERRLVDQLLLAHDVDHPAALL